MAEDMTKDEMIGFHKGAISTLIKEREELLKMTNVVEQIMQAHIKALQEMGVDINEGGEGTKQPKEKKKVAIEDLL